MKKENYFTTSFYLNLVLLIAFVPLFLFILIDNSNYRLSLIKQANEVIIDLSNTLEQDLTTQYYLNQQLLETIAIQPDINPGNFEKCQSLLKNFLNNFQQISFLGVANLNGEFLCSYPTVDNSINIKNRNFFNNAVEKDVYWSGYFYEDQISEHPTFGFGFPFSMAQSDQKYVLVAVQNLSDINNLFINLPLHKNIDITFFNSTGKLIFGSTTENLENNTNPKSILDLKPVFNERGEFLTIKEGGVEFLILNTAVNFNDRIAGYFSLRTPTRIIYEKVNQELIIKLVSLFLLVLVSIIITRQIIKKQILRPLEKTVTFSNEFENGKFDSRLNIVSKTKEMQILGKTINKLIESLVSELRIKENIIDRISALNRIDKNITRHVNIGDTYKLVLDIMQTQLKVDACVILRFEEKQKNLRCVATNGFLTIDQNEYFPAVCEELAYPIIELKKPLLIQNPALDSNISNWKYLEDEGFKYFYGIPLLLEGEIKGVVGIFQRDNKPLEADTIDYAETLSRQTTIAIENSELLSEIINKNSELQSAYEKTLEGWSKALELRDDETSGHTERVSEIAIEIAKKMGFDKNQIENMRRGALLHDIGKIGIPDSILLKPGKLTEDERKIIEKHPVFAFNQLEPIEFLHDAIQIPYCHHEKWDGTGYPRGLKGKEIPLEARIFSVVDVWDALLSDRPYRRAWPEAEVIEYMRAQSGKYFDPEILEIFLENIQELKEKYI